MFLTTWPTFSGILSPLRRRFASGTRRTAGAARSSSRRRHARSSTRDSQLHDSAQGALPRRSSGGHRLPHVSPLRPTMVKTRERLPRRGWHLPGHATLSALTSRERRPPPAVHLALRTAQISALNTDIHNPKATLATLPALSRPSYREATAAGGCSLRFGQRGLPTKVLHTDCPWDSPSPTRPPPANTQ